MNVSRRHFLAASGLAASSLSARSWTALASGPAPSSRLRVGVIGCGVRGKYLIGNLPESARVVALCDCAISRMTDTIHPSGKFIDVLADFAATQAESCDLFQDYREMLVTAELDAVIIATPDHHHVQAAMLALQAGLHVYLEKPISVSVAEGRQLANAVKATGKVLQVGSQQRTMEVNRFACEFIRDGGVGKISHVDFPNFPGPFASSTYEEEEEAPDGFAWDLFLGPTQWRPHNRKLWVKDEFKVDELMWRGWDLFRDFSGHLMTNWGAHSIDMVQYALGMDHTGPVRVEPTANISESALAADWTKKWYRKTPRPAGRFSDDSRFTPVQFSYANGVTVRLLPNIKEATFYGERGSIRIARNKYVCTPKDLITNGPDETIRKRWDGAGFVARPHLQNWLDAIHGSMPLNAPIEIGHRTASVCHLINLARELKQPLDWEPEMERFLNNDEANSRLIRPRRIGFELPKMV